ncbi:hypothetical protein [Thalassotalea ganghwensis]
MMALLQLTMKLKLARLILILQSNDNKRICAQMSGDVYLLVLAYMLFVGQTGQLNLQNLRKPLSFAYIGDLITIITRDKHAK